MAPIRLLIADDDGCVRKCLGTLLKVEGDIEVAGEACDGVQATVMTRELHPDVVLMDVEMPRMSGVEATRSIKQHSPGIGVVVMGIYDASKTDAERAGADCFLLKDCGRRALAQAIRQACEAPGPQRGLPVDERGAGTHGRSAHPVRS